MSKLTGFYAHKASLQELLSALRHLMRGESKLDN